MMNTRTTSWVARGHETSFFGRTTILDPWVDFSHAVSMHPFNARNITCEVCTVYSYKGNFGHKGVGKDGHKGFGQRYRVAGLSWERSRVRPTSPMP